MFKITPDVLILLLNLLRYTSCDELEDNRNQLTSELFNQSTPCSEYIECEESIDDFLIGKLTLPHMKIGDTVKIQFYEGFMCSHGILLPDGRSEEIINKLQKKQPISYRIDFPLTFFLPILYNIFINDNEICYTIKKRITDDLLTLEHTLNVVNGSVEVYTYNSHMPHFPEARKESCGLVDREIQIYEGTPLVVGGQSITRGEYPWLTAVYRNDSSGLRLICGGSLVTSKIILSAAHCFELLSFNAEKITTMLGRYNLTNSMEDGYTTHDIENIIPHPDYKPGPGFSDADLALLIMKEHVSFTKFIKPICLWREPAEESRIVNQTGVVVGWGSDENGNRLSIAPKKVNVKIVSAEVCLRSSIVFSKVTSLRTLCAGKRDGSGPCQGDSGGPLMLNRNGTWTVRGIVSLALTAHGGVDLQEYTVYCDVAKHMSWLQHYIKLNEGAVTGPLKDICGRTNTESRTEHPWFAAINVKIRTGELFLCTGTMVSPRSVLVTEMCNVDSHPASNIRVYPGRYDLSNMHEKGVVSREVEEILSFHIRYKNYDTGHDGLLLQLKYPVSFTQYVKPICLWSEPRDQSEIVGQAITLSGWIVYEVHDEISTVPKPLEVNIASLEQCQLLGHNVSTKSHVLCIPREQNLTGRVLMMKQNERWMLLCRCLYFHDSDKFCVLKYADLADKMSWIQRHMLS